MVKALSTPGQRKAVAFLLVFAFGVLFAFARLIMPLFVADMEPIDDIPAQSATMVTVALGALFASQTVGKFSPSVRDGKEPA